jgi:hypothetical protein
MPAASSPKRGPGLKSDACSNEVARWFDQQSQLSKDASRHAGALDTMRVGRPTMATGSSAGPLVVVEHKATSLVDLRKPKPKRESTPPVVNVALSFGDEGRVAASVTPAATRAKRKPPVPPSTRRSQNHPIPTQATPIAPTFASTVGADAMGVDPVTGEKMKPAYGGLKGVKTAYQEIFNAFGDPKTAETLKPVLAMAKPDAVENQSHKSEWADMVRGNEETQRHWRENALKTTNIAHDEPVIAAFGEVPGIAEDKARQRERLMEKVLGSRLYYGDLLNDDAAAALEETLMHAPPEEREKILETLRDVHAGTAVARGKRAPLSHDHYRVGYNPLAAAAEAKRRAEAAACVSSGPTRAEQARRARRKEIERAEMADEQRMKDAMREEAAALAAAKARGGVCCDPRKASPSKIGGDPSASQFDLGPYGKRKTETTTYQWQCGNLGAILDEIKRPDLALKTVDNPATRLTPAAGAVQWLDVEAPRNVVYPVPLHHLRRAPSEEEGFRRGNSTMRQSYQPRSRKDMAAQAKSQRATAAASKTMRSASTIPLGPTGHMDHPRHRMQTGYERDFPPRRGAGGGAVARATSEDAGAAVAASS